MKNRIKLSFLVLLFGIPGFAQVGIGTTDPQETLHISGNSSTIRVEGLNSENHDKKANSDLIEYSNNGGELFINFAEELIDTPGKIVVLDSLRYLTNHGTPDHLPYIYNQLLKLKK